MVQSKKPDYSYEDWKIRRIRLSHSKDITTRKKYRKGKRVKSQAICALCGRPLSLYNYASRHNELRVNAIFLNTETILYYYLCDDSRACYNNYIKLKEEVNNGN